jgi:hypothetical protein
MNIPYVDIFMWVMGLCAVVGVGAIAGGFMAVFGDLDAGEGDE